MHKYRNSQSALVLLSDLLLCTKVVFSYIKEHQSRSQKASSLVLINLSKSVPQTHFVVHLFHSNTFYPEVETAASSGSDHVRPIQALHQYIQKKTTMPYYPRDDVQGKAIGAQNKGSIHVLLYSINTQCCIDSSG